MYELEEVIDSIKKVGSTKTNVILSTQFSLSLYYKFIFKDKKAIKSLFNIKLFV